MLEPVDTDGEDNRGENGPVNYYSVYV